MTGLLASDSLVGTRYFSADEVLSPYIYVFIAAYLVSLVFTPVMRTIAIYYGIIDQPDGLRKMHNVPIAYLGGLAVFLAWLTGLAASQFLPLHRIEPGMPQSLVIHFPLIVGACAIVLLGLWDDIFHLSPKMKILGQAVAGICLLQAGIGRRSAWLIIGPVLAAINKYLGEYLRWAPSSINEYYNSPLVAWASIIFVIAVVVACCNAANLMDGLDGLCGGVTSVVSFGFLFLAVNLAMVSGSVNTNEDALRVVLGLALLGGVLGFVPYNFNPASIFMGDTGSMFLGFCCATMMVLFAAGGHIKWFVASMVMFSLPLLDTALAFVRRYVNNRPLFSADRFHFHHQLVARGFSVRQTVFISYGLTIVFCLLGAGIVYIRTRYAICVYLVVFGSIIVAAFKMGMVHERVEPAAKSKAATNGGAGAQTQDSKSVVRV